MSRMGKAGLRDTGAHALGFGVKNPKALERAMDAEGKDINRTQRADSYGFNDKKDMDNVQSRLPEGDMHFNENGELLDTNGNVYTDEGGNSLTADADGMLVNADGEYARIGDDGILETTDTPTSREGEARKLDTMRQNSTANDKMLDAQNNTHHGMNGQGQVTNSKGQPVKTKAGLAVSLDSEGRMIDETGNLVHPSELKESDLDKKGYDKKTDDEGNQYLQHKGAGALRSSVNPSSTSPKGAPKSATKLAQDANRLDNQAKRAQQKVQDLKNSGAPAFAVRTAQEYADGLSSMATSAQQEYDKELTSGTGDDTERVTADHVESSQRSVANAQTAHTQAEQRVQQAQETLTQMEQQTAPLTQQQAETEEARATVQQAQQEEASAKQEVSQAFNAQVANPTPQNKQRHEQAVASVQTAQKTHTQAKQRVAKAETKLGEMQKQYAPQVQQQQQQRQHVAQTRNDANETRKAQSKSRDSARNVQIAHNAGRTYGEVEQASSDYTKSRSGYQKAYQDYERAEATGNPARIKQATQQLERQANDMNQKNNNYQRVQHRPQGTVAQVDKARSQVSRLQNQHKNATTPQEKRKVGNQINRAQQRLDRLQQPSGWTGGTPQQRQQAMSNMNVDQNTSRAQMKAQGVVSYGDFAKAVETEQSSIKDNRVALRRISDKMNSSAIMTATERGKLQDESKEIQSKINQSSQKLSTLRNNSAGMLDSKGYQPRVAKRPIRKHGGAVMTQLSNLAGMQTMHESLKHREQSGHLDEAGKLQLQGIESRMSFVQRELVGMGINEESLVDSATTNSSVQDVQRSWLGYMNGKEK